MAAKQKEKQEKKTYPFKKDKTVHGVMYAIILKEIASKIILIFIFCT